MPIRSTWFIVLFRSSVSLLIIWQLFYPLLKVGIDVSNYCCWIASFSLQLSVFCFIYFGAQLLGAYTLNTVMSSQWTHACIIIKYPILFPIIIFFFLVLKFILSEPALFLVTICKRVPGPSSNVCVRGDIPTPTSNSQIPAKVQEFNSASDIIYPKRESHSTGKGLSPIGLPTTSDASCKLRLYLCLWLTGYKLEVPNIPSLGSTNLLEWLTRLRKTPLLTRLPVYYKGC